MRKTRKARTARVGARPTLKTLNSAQSGGSDCGEAGRTITQGMKLSKAERKEAGETKDDAQKAKEQAMGKSEERSVLGSIKFEGTLTKKVRASERHPTSCPDGSIQDAKVANRNVKVRHGATERVLERWTKPKLSRLRVHVRTGYNLVEGNRRASRKPYRNDSHLFFIADGAPLGRRAVATGAARRCCRGRTTTISATSSTKTGT